jgi:hypothetical protein
MVFHSWSSHKIEGPSNLRARRLELGTKLVFVERQQGAFALRILMQAMSR